MMLRNVLVLNVSMRFGCIFYSKNVESYFVYSLKKRGMIPMSFNLNILSDCG